MSLGSDRTLARARRLMKQRVSSDHLPPPRQPKRQVWRALVFQKVQGTSFPCGGGQVAAKQLHQMAMWDSISTQGKDQSCVNGQLSPVENGQPLYDHFKATTVNTTQSGQVQVPHENIGGDTSSSLTADACRSRLQREAASSRAPQKSSTLRGGGQGRREDGHTGRYETKEGEKTTEEKNTKEGQARISSKLG